MYLPQFHRVKENDEWWGEGFTEWTAVKKAKPLFEGHYQPREPQNHYYYDLLDKAAMEWQADLMHAFGIDAQCIYHYWFKDGRRILEKPAENLLAWKDIDMPFCFCWANITWARSWTNVECKNVWADAFEKNGRDDSTGVLLEQQYGGEQQWREHFEYLLSFFRDKRYFKKDGKPIFVIYAAKFMDCLDKMMALWKEWAAEEGFPGLYIIAANNGGIQYKNVDLELSHEPTRTFAEIKAKNRDKKELILDYGSVWSKILEYSNGRKKQAYGGLTGYDDSPRRGRQGMIVRGASPELFRECLSELIAKNMANQNNLIFLDAWNEWGEGMYLEPDQRFGDQYLQAVAYAKKHYRGYLEKYRHMDDRKSLIREMKCLEEKVFRYEKYWRTLDQWLSLKERDVKLGEILKENHIHTVAVYGLGMLGRHLLEELREGPVRVLYGIDVRKGQIKADIPMYALCDELPEADAVIVTVDYDFETIKKELEKKSQYKVISLTQIIDEL